MKRKKGTVQSKKIINHKIIQRENVTNDPHGSKKAKSVTTFN